MFVTLRFVLLVLDNLEDDENEQDDTEKIVTDALRSVLVEAINQYNQFKHGRIDENGAPVRKKPRVVSRLNWQRAHECIVQNM
jgi:hypothetical protein